VSVPAEVNAMTGAEALPRSNGELVFAEPWQARAFGVAVGLVQEQGLGWEAFRSRLIDEIGSWEREHRDGQGDPYAYYERWLAALERLVLERGLVSADELEAAVLQVAADDSHDHGHDHR
jgi:nitrile hydratase accessory protein